MMFSRNIFSLPPASVSSGDAAEPGSQAGWAPCHQEKLFVRRSRFPSVLLGSRGHSAAQRALPAVSARVCPLPALWCSLEFASLSGFLSFFLSLLLGLGEEL